MKKWSLHFEKGLKKQKEKKKKKKENRSRYGRIRTRCGLVSFVFLEASGRVWAIDDFAKLCSEINVKIFWNWNSKGNEKNKLGRDNFLVTFLSYK